MRIAFNRMVRRNPWGGGSQFLTVFVDYLKSKEHEVFHELVDDLDAIVMLDPRHEDGGFDYLKIAEYKQKNQRTRVLHRVNDTGATRGGRDLDMLIVNANRKVADHTAYISEWVKDYYTQVVLDSTNVYEERMNRLSHWSSRPNTVIHNGCDTSFFYSKEPTYDSTRSINLVTHHWSNNPMKGLDLYKHIDDLIESGANIRFTYVGRYPTDKHNPKHTNIIQPLYGNALGDELRKHDVYVTAARWEACGSHHVEGAACGLPVIFHKDGGGVVEMCQRYGVGINNVNEFSQALNTVVTNYDAFHRMTALEDLSAESMCAKYEKIMSSIVVDQSS